MVEYIENVIKEYFEELEKIKTIDELNYHIRFVESKYAHNLSYIYPEFDEKLKEYVKNNFKVNNDEKIKYVCDFIKYPKKYDESAIFPKIYFDVSNIYK